MQPETAFEAYDDARKPFSNPRNSAKGGAEGFQKDGHADWHGYELNRRVGRRWPKAEERQQWTPEHKENLKG